MDRDVALAAAAREVNMIIMRDQWEKHPPTREEIRERVRKLREQINAWDQAETLWVSDAETASPPADSELLRAVAAEYELSAPRLFRSSRVARLRALADQMEKRA